MTIVAGAGRRRFLIAVAAVALISGSLGLAQAAEETYAQMRLSGTTATGVLAAQGPGELLLEPGPALALEGYGKRIVVEEYRGVTYLVEPGGAAHEESTPGPNPNRYVFEDASIVLEEAMDTFKGLVMATGDGDEIATGPTPVEEAPLVAYKDMGLILDRRTGQATDTNDHVTFTYVADGDRFAVPADAAEVDGSPGVYLWMARFSVVENGQAHSFVSQQTKENVLPGVERHEQAYYIVRIEEGALAVGGTTMGWLESPRVGLDGTLASTASEGALVHQGERHTLDHDALSATGTITLDLEPAGEPELLESGRYLYRSYTYPASTGEFSGSLQQLTIAGVPIRPSSPLPEVATTAGVLAVVGTVAFALTQKGKWLLLGALSPLYAKTQRDRLLESPQRERLMQAIEANPGIHLSGLRELAALSWGTTVYHLRLMEKAELVTSVSRAGLRHFFVKTPGGDQDCLRRAVAAIVGQETAHRVAFAVISLPGSPQKKLAEHLGVSPRVVAHHTTRLQKAGLLTKKREKGSLLCFPATELSDAIAMLDTGEATAGVRHKLKPRVASEPLQPVPVADA